MTLFAHAGHWIAQLLYLAPVIAMVGAILWARMKARRHEGPNGNQQLNWARRSGVSARRSGNPPRRTVQE